MKIRDIDIRKQLHIEIALEHHDDPSTKIIDELGLCRGQVRVDIAAVNGKFYGYEIKSPQDTLVRLPKQAEVYSQIFDYMTLIMHESFYQKSLEIIPDWWGITIANFKNNQLILEEVKTRQENKSINPLALVELIWKDEAIEMLKQKDAHKGYINKSRPIIWSRLCEVYDIEDLKTAVRNILKTRHYREFVQQ